MKALVTGGTGFIGRNIAQKLVEEGWDVIVTGNESEPKIANFKGKVLNPSFLGIDWDQIGHVDALFHQAALNDTQNLDEDEMMLSNFKSSKALFDYVIEHGCKHIVFATSTATYGDSPAPYVEAVAKQNPLNPYAKSKLLMERYAMELAEKHPDVKLVGLRYCNVYGPGEAFKGKRSTMIYQLAQQILNGNPKIFTDGSQKRDYAYVKDVVTANLLAAKSEVSCIVNCGSGETTTFNKIVESLCKLLGKNRETIFIDNPYGANYQSYTECDMSLAKEKIGFVPVYDFEKGLKDYYDSGFLVKKE